jgi:hypothetical protein
MNILSSSSKLSTGSKVDAVLAHYRRRFAQREEHSPKKLKPDE